MIKFDIRNLFTGNVQFTAEIECAEDALLSTKNGLSVRWAMQNGADLREANLYGANLYGANLREAEGISTLIIDGGIRSDGYRFLLTRTEPGPWRIKAGCRNFTLDEAQEHWNAKRPEGEPLGDETRLIIAHMVSVAKLRNWPEQGEEREQENAA